MDNLKNKRVLVTGGNGYIGTHLVRNLKEKGAIVYIIDLKSKGLENEFCIDITDLSKVQKVINEVQPQYIFHLAALLNRERDFANHEQIIKVNYNGTLNLLIALKDIPYENFVFTSTSDVYGNNIAPFNENILPCPVSPYSMSKLFAEVAIRTYSNIYEKNYTIVRLFLFIGNNMSPNFFMSQLLDAFRKNETFKMTKGEQTRDYLHIDDVIRAMLFTAVNKNAKNEIFNVCSGKSTSLREFAINCRDIMKSSSEIEFGAYEYRNNEVWNMNGDNSKLLQLGFKPKYNLEQAINEIINK